MSASIHDKLNRVRKPRVHITYEVETEGAEVLRELPFIVGIMGDFSGDPTAPLRPLADRKFIQIDRDNFNDVLAGMTPGLKLKVDNKLSEEGGEMGVDLKFNSIEDFEPARVAQQVPALRTLLETRAKLRARRDLTVKWCNSTPRMSCVSPRGAFYAFPSLHINEGDDVFVKELCRQRHVLVVHGSGFGQKPGTRHFRIVFLPDEPTLSNAYQSIAEFMAERYK